VLAARGPRRRGRQSRSGRSTDARGRAGVHHGRSARRRHPAAGARGRVIGRPACRLAPSAVVASIGCWAATGPCPRRPAGSRASSDRPASSTSRKVLQEPTGDHGDLRDRAVDTPALFAGGRRPVATDLADELAGGRPRSHRSSPARPDGEGP
jgi:hypothetical protein